jgi:hypothetical protein
MAKATQAQQSRIALDGIVATLPLAVRNNLEPGPLFVEKSGLLDLVNVVARQGDIYFPMPAKIIGIYSRVRTQLGTAAGIAALGIIGSLTKFGTQSHAISAVAGTTFIWTIADANINAGDVVTFSGDGGATTTGDIDVTYFWQPRV